MVVVTGPVGAARVSFRVMTLVLLLCAIASGSAAQDETVLPEGPWGDVKLTSIQIRLPASMVPDEPLPLQPWVFEAGRETTRKRLLAAGVEVALAEQLLSTYSQSGGGSLRPNPAMIRQLDPDARSRLYEALRELPANVSQRSPHRFRRTRLEQRFRDLSPATVALLREFLYERPSLPRSLLLADLPSVMRLTESPSERSRLIQAVSAQESMLLRLELDATSDTGALASYWGRGGRRRDLEIFLSSLVDEGARQLDAIYLLPAFGRSFLFTYPRLENAARRDCFWTALNFFLPSPDDRLVGPKVARKMVESYQLVKGPLQLGDMLVLWRPTGEAEHAAIYIAGDIYFTKNGTNLAMPWLLMPLEEILERYDEAEHTPLTHYRLKRQPDDR
jgi:hypothetical protein